MQELEKAGISGLSENIVNIRADEPLPDKNRYLEKNALYKPVVFSDELADSKNFKDAYGFKGTVFGDVTTLPTESDNYILEEVPGEYTSRLRIMMARYLLLQTELQCTIRRFL